MQIDYNRLILNKDDVESIQGMLNALNSIVFLTDPPADDPQKKEVVKLQNLINVWKNKFDRAAGGLNL